jgi:hypothetical protein
VSVADDVSWSTDLAWGLGYSAMFGVIVFLITRFNLEAPSPDAVAMDIAWWKEQSIHVPAGVYHSPRGACLEFAWKLFLLDTHIDFGETEMALKIHVSNKPPIVTAHTHEHTRRTNAPLLPHRNAHVHVPPPPTRMILTPVAPLLLWCVCVCVCSSFSCFSR